MATEQQQAAKLEATAAAVSKFQMAEYPSTNSMRYCYKVLTIFHFQCLSHETRAVWAESSGCHPSNLGGCGHLSTGDRQDPHYSG